VENDENARRYGFIEKINDKLRVLFPDGITDAEEKRAEVLEYAAGKALGLPGIRDIAAARELPLADLEKLWGVVDRIVDAH
jgi:hypothetical protein